MSMIYIYICVHVFNHRVPRLGYISFPTHPPSQRLRDHYYYKYRSARGERSIRNTYLRVLQRIEVRAACATCNMFCTRNTKTIHYNIIRINNNVDF